MELNDILQMMGDFYRINEDAIHFAVYTALVFGFGFISSVIIDEVKNERS